MAGTCSPAARRAEQECSLKPITCSQVHDKHQIYTNTNTQGPTICSAKETAQFQQSQRSKEGQHLIQQCSEGKCPLGSDPRGCQPWTYLRREQSVWKAVSISSRHVSLADRWSSRFTRTEKGLSPERRWAPGWTEEPSRCTSERVPFAPIENVSLRNSPYHPYSPLAQ